MSIRKAIKILEGKISNPSLGLPEEIFLFISRITPLVNVDLLIEDEQGRILLAWRDDKSNGKGWHIPGGIVRYKETWETRIKKVAEIEIGTKVKFNPIPIALNQVICKQTTRGHFISLLFNCFLSNKYLLKNKGLKENDRGYLKWHNNFPDNLIKIQKKIYKKIIKQYEDK